MKQKCAIGIDLGGTTIKGTVMNADGTFRHLKRVPTEAHKSGSRVLENILSLIEHLIHQEGGKDHILGVGLGTPGFVDTKGVIIGGCENLPGFKGTRFYDAVRDKFSLRATAANDVTVATFAEFKYGAGRGVQNIVCLALGTGVGGGIVTNGHLYKGTHGMAAELGHVVVETGGLQCNCGLKGCLERYASATGIVTMAKIIAADTPEPEVTPFVREVRKDPEAVTSKMVYDFVNHKDIAALRVHETVCEKLAIGIGIFLNSLAPDRIILGGGVMKAGQIIIDTVNKYVPLHCWPDIASRCTIVPAELSEDAGVLGCGAMVFEDLNN